MPDIGPQLEGWGGVSLRALLGLPLPAQEAVGLAIRIGMAAERGYRAGMPFGQILPENIYLGPQDSRAVFIGSFRKAPPNASYLSPEQILGHPAGEASDAYALGCILYEMLTGQPPFASDPDPEARLTHPPHLPRTAVRAIPEALERVVVQALVKEPEGRFARVGEMVDALQRSQPTSEWLLLPGKHRALLIGILAFLVVLATVLGVWLHNQRARREVEVRESDVMALVGQGEEYLERKDWDLAAARCGRALELDPGLGEARGCVREAEAGRQLEALFAQAEVAIRQEQWELALALLERIGEARADYPAFDAVVSLARHGYGSALLADGKVKQAARQFEALLTVQPGNQPAWQQEHRALLYLAGEKYGELGAWYEAGVALQELYELEPEYQPDVVSLLYTAYMEVGRALEVQGNWCGAWQAYDQACQVGEAATDDVRDRRERAAAYCFEPTPVPLPSPTATLTPTLTPTPAPSPTPRPTARPIRYCWVGNFQGTTSIPYPLVEVSGSVMGHHDEGVQDILVRVKAFNWYTQVRTQPGGGFGVAGLGQGLPWTVSLPDHGVEVQVPILNGGQRGLVQFREQPCE